MNVCRLIGHKWREVSRITWKPQEDGTAGTAKDRCARCHAQRRRFITSAPAAAGGTNGSRADQEAQSA